MAPLQLTADWGSLTSYLVPLLIGVGFGAVLEMSGFGDSRKLAAQFYLREMTVLKVMFTGIIVAGSLIGLCSAMGWVDYERLFVNPTYLLPGIVGGLIMGVGFIIGGFCPGTSVVASSTLKLDGILFLAGVLAGIFVFGESVDSFASFFTSSYLGRLTLQDLFGVDMGVVLVGVVLMALFAFLAAEVAEDYFGRGLRGSALRFLPRRPAAVVFGAVLLAVVGVAALRGQPDPERRWQLLAATTQPAIDQRSAYVNPMEVAELTRDTSLYTHVIDVRSESHFNLFHLHDSTNVTMDELHDPTFVANLRAAPANTVVFTVSDDELLATEAYKLLVAQGVLNVYIVEGGINGWLRMFPPLECLATPSPGPHTPETLAFTFYRAAGDCCNAAYPELSHQALPTDCYLEMYPGSGAESAAGAVEPPKPAVAFEHKVTLQRRQVVTGGCG